MTVDRPGVVVTFYSYNGGTGRTMALANVAWILAAAGLRVLVVDWDLESPGLHRYFHPFVDAPAVESSGGVIDMIRAYEWEAGRKSIASIPGRHQEFARVGQHALALTWPHFPGDGRLDLLPAGLQNTDYTAHLTGTDWDEFYGRKGGDLFFDAMRDDMRRHYDFTLIDSRTGLSDVADICTLHLPDLLVGCFTLSEKSIAGAARVADRVRLRGIEVLPVPMRVDPAAKERADAGRQFAMQRFPDLPAGMSPAERSHYWNAVEIPYRPYYACEEILAPFGDAPGQTTSLLAAYERLTSRITQGEVTALPPMDEALRARIATRFVRGSSPAEQDVALRHAPADVVWAEWIGALLTTAGLRVHYADSPQATANSARQLTLVSASYTGAPADVVPRERAGARPDLVVCVDDSAPPAGHAAGTAAFVSGRPAEVAMQRVLHLVGRGIDDVDPDRIGARFPGDVPLVFHAPARNANFTGREDDLREMRARMRGGRPAAQSGPALVALHGMGGVGKTQLALEYAHRYRNAYDVIWWIDAARVTGIDATLAELGARLGAAGGTRGVVGALERGEPSARWLLILDDADAVDEVLARVPRGPGHVLITSRGREWDDYAEAVRVDVFERPESIAHLRRRVPAIGPEEAGRVAAVLGDLPIAVAAGGAWLAETGQPVGDYLHGIERHGPDRVVGDVWSASLDLLRERSADAYRLLELFAVLAPEIALDLVYSEATAGYGPRITALVQHLHRLSLVRLERAGNRIRVHRLLQHVVRNRMTAAELRLTRHEAHLLLGRLRPAGDVDDTVTWPRLANLWPHLEVSGADGCHDAAVRELLVDRVRHARHTGGPVLEERLDQRWTAMLADASDAPDLRRQILRVRGEAANRLRDRGRFGEALALGERVLADQAGLLGPAHPDTLTTAGGVAASLRALGRYRQARDLGERTYASWRERCGDDHPGTLTARGGHAVDLRLAGEFAAALAIGREVWERRLAVCGERHAGTCEAGGDLGRDLRATGEHDESVKLLAQVARLHEEAFGGASLRTLAARANLAVSLRVAGRPGEADDLLATTYEQLNEALGPAHPDSLACRHSRALCLLEIGEITRAIRELEEVRQGFATVLGERHPSTLLCRNNLAVAHRADGESGRAAALAREVAVEVGAVLGELHPYTKAVGSEEGVLLDPG
ncbi:FxSxx-COOH system tetratricopeptide repeat protein [Actinoplanes sp. NPDC023714]|uniref:FxSxx-COOH system tetratricopeptide repeat protein n=1 Tax=Actinoplanes sp. NPDC023714 TaxID=3154322 RepID=UPI0033CD3EFB